MSTGIIGGADGPTGIFVAATGVSVLSIFLLALVLGLVTGYLYRRRKHNNK